MSVSVFQFPSSYKDASYWIRAYTNLVWPHLNLMTLAKTYFLNQVTFTGSRGEDLNTSFWRMQFNSQQKETAAFPPLFFVIKEDSEMVFNKLRMLQSFLGEKCFKVTWNREIIILRYTLKKLKDRETWKCYLHYLILFWTFNTWVKPANKIDEDLQRQKHHLGAVG